MTLHQRSHRSPGAVGRPTPGVLMLAAAIALLIDPPRSAAFVGFGALMTLAGVPLAFGVARLLKVRRFRHHHVHRHHTMHAPHVVV